MAKTIEVNISKWVSILYIVCAVVLIPWIFILADYLPSRHVVRHWALLWSGFDIIMLIVIFCNIYLLLKHSYWVVVSATVLATLFLVDVWFDVLTSRPGKEEHQAIFFAIIESGLALLTARIVYKLVHRFIPNHDVKLVS